MDPATEAENAVDDATQAINAASHPETSERIAAAQVKALAALATAVGELAGAASQAGNQRVRRSAQLRSPGSCTCRSIRCDRTWSGRHKTGARRRAELSAPPSRPAVTQSPLAPESRPSLARYDGPPGGEWAVRPAPGALDGATRPLPPGSGPAQAGSTAPPPVRYCEPKGQTWDGCATNTFSAHLRGPCVTRGEPLVVSVGCARPDRSPAARGVSMNTQTISWTRGRAGR